MVKVNYKLWCNGELLSESTNSSSPFEFELGPPNSDAIRCWEVALPTMRRGEEAHLTCAPDYAFGEKGAPPKVPPNATLECELSLLSWASPAARRMELAERYTPTSNPEEEVYDQYKQDLSSGAMTGELNLTGRPGPKEVYKLDDPRLRKMVPRNQRIEGRHRGYRWSENEATMDLFVAVPNGTAARDVRCAISADRVSVALAAGAGGGAGPAALLLEGEWFGRVIASECVWALANERHGDCVHLALRKAPSHARIWGSVVAAGPPAGPAAGGAPPARGDPGAPGGAA